MCSATSIIFQDVCYLIFLMAQHCFKFQEPMNSDTKTKLRGVTFDLDFYTHPIAAILMQKMDE